MDRIKIIADHYGLESQLNQLNEEMGELLQAISKYRRVNGEGMPVRGFFSQKKARKDVIEEIADVLICAKEIIYLLDAHDEVLKMQEEKLIRTIEGML